MPSDSRTFEVCGLPPGRHHAPILETGDKHGIDDAIILNDHDARLFRYRFEAKQPNDFRIGCLESSPEIWRVEIRRIAAA
jgi:uncharacterized protein (DUF2249 family)